MASTIFNKNGIVVTETFTGRDHGNKIVLEFHANGSRLVGAEVAELVERLSKWAEQDKTRWHLCKHDILKKDCTECRAPEPNVLEHVGKELSEILGQQHNLRAVVRFFHLWRKDPNFNPDDELQRIEDQIGEWHRRVVALSQLVDAKCKSTQYEPKKEG